MFKEAYHCGGINTIGYKIFGITFFFLMLFIGIISFSEMKGWIFFLTLPAVLFVVVPFLDKPQTKEEKRKQIRESMEEHKRIIDDLKKKGWKRYGDKIT